MLCKHSVGSDGRTLYERWKGKAVAQATSEFGEKANTASTSRARRRARSSSRLGGGEGYFFGNFWRTGEAIVGNRAGVKKVSAFGDVTPKDSACSGEDLGTTTPMRAHQTFARMRSKMGSRRPSATRQEAMGSSCDAKTPWSIVALSSVRAVKLFFARVECIMSSHRPHQESRSENQAGASFTFGVRGRFGIQESLIRPIRTPGIKHSESGQ